MSVPARLGIAFHKAMEKLKPLSRKYDRSTATDFAQLALNVFREAFAAQQRASAKQLRERRSEWPARHVTRMENVIITTARAMADGNQVAIPAGHGSGRRTFGGPLVEHPVRSKDGALAGVIDRVDFVTGGPKIVDYKTTAKLTDDEIAKHSRQIKFYAYLWRDESGEWPREGTLYYPVAGRECSFTIEPGECQAIADEARQEASSLDATFSKAPENLANPGEVCSWCDFRPWCEPFWRMQGALADDPAFFAGSMIGFEGSVLEVARSGDNLLLDVTLPNRTVELRVSLDQFPHLTGVKAGDRLRVLGAKLAGTPSRPGSQVSDRTEIYVVV